MSQAALLNHIHITSLIFFGGPRPCLVRHTSFGKITEEKDCHRRPSIVHREIIFQLGYSSGHIGNPFFPFFYPHCSEYPAPFHLMWPRISNQKILDPLWVVQCCRYPHDFKNRTYLTYVHLIKREVLQGDWHRIHGGGISTPRTAEGQWY